MPKFAPIHLLLQSNFFAVISETVKELGEKEHEPLAKVAAK